METAWLCVRMCQCEGPGPWWPLRMSGTLSATQGTTREVTQCNTQIRLVIRGRSVHLCVFLRPGEGLACRESLCSHPQFRTHSLAKSSHTRRRRLSALRMCGGSRESLGANRCAESVCNIIGARCCKPTESSLPFLL